MTKSEETVSAAEQGEILLKTPTLYEDIKAIKGLPASKAPGVDGIPVEFFQTFMGETSGDLYSLIKEIFITKNLCRTLNKSKISL